MVRCSISAETNHASSFDRRSGNRDQRWSGWFDPRLTNHDVRATHKDVGRYESTDGLGRAGSGTPAEGNARSGCRGRNCVGRPTGCRKVGQCRSDCRNSDREAASSWIFIVLNSSLLSPHPSPFLEQRVYKRRHRRSLSQHDECAKQDHDDDDGKEPEFLALPHKRPEIL
jgi:hypothetical protein